MEEKQIDVAIIGSGSAGLYALGKVKPSGKKFVLINGGAPGTTCARVGCMPSKAMIQVAENYHRKGILGRYGVEGHNDLTLDKEEVMEHVREMRDTFVGRVLSNSTDNMSEEVFIQGYAKFIDPHLLDVEGQHFRADKIIIATGSRPIIPAPWKAFGDRILTTDEVFEQEQLPESIAIIGLGVIGLEIGQSMARLGGNVTGFDMLETIGGLDDPEVAKSAIEILGREFPIHLGVAAEITEEGDKLRVTAGDQSVLVDKVLASLGRRPNLDNLAIENAGIDLDERGIPGYNRNTMQIGDSHIFIAGDVDGERLLLHEAGDEGRIAGHNASGTQIEAFQRKVTISINFCDPNICHVGARWAELDEATTTIGEVKMAPVGRALIMGKNRGIIRVYGEKSSGRLLGAEMICTKGENLAHLLAWCIQQQLTVGDLLRMPFYHPVIEEALQAALYDLYGKVDAKNEGAITELVPMT
ncbi:dihydrolipoyl dehydrogenase [Candidatus Vondammii sp. HM_W22]|uniref:dihydrolipoyl dehydrogenase n=1 Tax=Candidatus Vondammii sp. HM_W22 TaxID=2687299 RepID=UPI001F13306C|nr:dihydrolipoyl dehydrogenase [Candidatus Vondammii sp. HM_W22]